MNSTPLGSKHLTLLYYGLPSTPQLPEKLICNIYGHCKAADWIALVKISASAHFIVLSLLDDLNTPELSVQEAAHLSREANDYFQVLAELAPAHSEWEIKENLSSLRYQQPFFSSLPPIEGIQKNIALLLASRRFLAPREMGTFHLEDITLKEVSLALVKQDQLDFAAETAKGISSSKTREEVFQAIAGQRAQNSLKLGDHQKTLEKLTEQLEKDPLALSITSPLISTCVEVANQFLEKDDEARARVIAEEIRPYINSTDQRTDAERARYKAGLLYARLGDWREVALIAEKSYSRSYLYDFAKAALEAEQLDLAVKLSENLLNLNVLIAKERIFFISLINACLEKNKLREAKSLITLVLNNKRWDFIQNLPSAYCLIFFKACLQTSHIKEARKIFSSFSRDEKREQKALLLQNMSFFQRIRFRLSRS